MQGFRTFGGRADQAAQADRTDPPSRRVAAAIRAVRFAAVGGLGMVVNMAALYALYLWVHLPLVVATALAFEIAVIHNFVLNDQWTFGARALSVGRFVKFNTSVLGGLGVNVLVVWALVRGGMYFLLANAIGIGAAFAVNFTSSVIWVWGRRDR